MKFMEEQVKEPVPSFYEIMTDQSNRRFNEDFEEKKNDGMEVYDMCYNSNYAKKMEEEPDFFRREAIVYEEHKTLVETQFSQTLNFKPPANFTGGGATDYLEAFSEKEELPEYLEKDVNLEFQKLKEFYKS